MWRDDQQKCAAIGVLLSHMNATEWWSPLGPTMGGVDALELPLSHGERVLLRVCWDIWNGDGKVKLTELDVLDLENTRRVLSLLLAVVEDSGAVDRWVAANKREPERLFVILEGGAHARR